MPSYVALLRGIAPTDPKMKNSELKRVFESLGFENVKTVISSGNVIFESPDRSPRKLEDRIEVAMHEHLGKPCSTIVRSRKQIDDMTALDVFDAYDDNPTARCNVTFLKQVPQRSQGLPEVGPGSQLLALRNQAVFSVVDSSASKTPDLMSKLERAFGKQITTRTWKTVFRIAKAFER
jgi:uncharacterized protein (DUF1697 family)